MHDDQKSGIKEQMTGDTSESTKPVQTPYQMSEAELKARKRRSAWLAAGLWAFFILIFCITAVRMSENIGVNAS